MTFQQLTYVVEVARCASINKAAERLYTTRAMSAVSCASWRTSWVSKFSGGLTRECL